MSTIKSSVSTNQDHLLARIDYSMGGRSIGVSKGLIRLCRQYGLLTHRSPSALATLRMKEEERTDG